jgi:hypothetical protein
MDEFVGRIDHQTAVLPGEMSAIQRFPLRYATLSGRALVLRDFEDRSVPYSEREHDISVRDSDANVHGDVNARDTKEPTKPTLLWT